MKHIGVYVRNDLTWSTHTEQKLRKAVSLLNNVKRNTSPLSLTHQKVCLYKSLILPFIRFGSQCIHLTNASKSKLETFQKRVLKYVLNEYVSSYHTLLSKTKMLPLSHFFQILDLRELSNTYNSEQSDFKLWETA